MNSKVNELLTLKEQNAVYENGLYDIRRYLNSSKFGSDIMVNKNDILLRIQEILNDADSIQ